MTLTLRVAILNVRAIGNTQLVVMQESKLRRKKKWVQTSNTAKL